MRPLLLALLVAANTTPAFAPHAGHATDEPIEAPVDQPEPEDPHDEHRAAPQPARPTATDPHAGPDMIPGAAPPPPPEAPPPPAAFSGPRHAADTVFGPAAMRAAREDLRSEEGDIRTWWAMADQAEARFSDGSDDYLWDVQGWYGGDFNKIWVKSEGEGTFGEELEEAEVQALWSRAVTPWFDFQAGVRYDFRPDPERAHLVVGLQGLVPYQFELDAAAFLSDEGDLSARIEAEYEQRITQRLLLQPRVELDLAAQDVPEIGVGAGLSSAELGLRLRYEIAREFAPYIGVEYERSFGDTADFIRAAGEDPDSWKAVLGVRAWF